MIGGAVNEIPGMNGLCWSDLDLTEDEIYNLQMAGAFDYLTDDEDYDLMDLDND